MNKFSPGCCCGGCQAFHLGFDRNNPAIGGGFEFFGTTELLQANLDDVSLAGHDVTVNTTRPRNFSLAAGGRWASKSAYLPVLEWDLFNFWNHYIGDDSVDGDVDIEIIWALENTEDIYDDTSIILGLTYVLATETQTITLKSDWPGTTYPFGAITARQQSVVLGDSLAPGPVFRVRFSADSVWTEFGAQPAFVNPPRGLHRPLNSPGRRRLHIINNNDYAWQFDGLIMNGRNDDRTIDRSAPDTPCRRILSPNRSIIGNEPFAIEVTYDTHVAPPKFFSFGNGNDNFGQAAARAEVDHQIVAQPAMFSLPSEFQGDEIFYDAVDAHLEFLCEVAGMEIVSLDESGKPSTIEVRITIQAYGNGWVPIRNPFNSSQWTWEQLSVVPDPTIIDCVLNAWERGEFPTLTIVPSGAGVTVNGEPATLVTAWPVPTLPVRKRFVWEEIVFDPEEDPFGSYIEAELETTDVTRTIEITGALPDAP